MQPAALPLNVSDVEGFRYRVEDVCRAVTGVAVRDARMREIKSEMLNSKRLQAYFEDNPRDMQLLEHAKLVRPSKVLQHVGHVPSYLKAKGEETAVAAEVTREAAAKAANAARERRGKRRRSGGGGYGTGSDPLTSFTYKSGNDIGSLSGRNAWKLQHKKGKVRLHRSRS